MEHTSERRLWDLVLRSYACDIFPGHVHVFREGREIGRWDIEHRRPMDPFDPRPTDPLDPRRASRGSIGERGAPERGPLDRDHGRRLSAVDFASAVGAVVVRFGDGRIYAVPLGVLWVADTTLVTSTTLSSHGYAALIEQESGNVFEVPWDVVLHRADAAYPYRSAPASPGPGVSENRAGCGDRAPAREIARGIGERIRTERRFRGWTLSELAACTGIGISNLSRLEKGRHLPRLETLDKVAEALGLPVAALAIGRPPSP